jgi:hypothetical protein
MKAATLPCFFFVRRNYHLDWDGFSHCSAIEQNFNPLVEDINRRQKLGLEVFFLGGGRRRGR